MMKFLSIPAIVISLSALYVGCAETPEKQYVEPTVTLESESYKTGSDASTFTVPVSTDTDYTVYVPKACRDWISIADTRAALRNDLLTVAVTANSSVSVRVAEIELRDVDDKRLAAFTVTQLGCPPPVVETTLHSIYELNRKSGIVNSHTDYWQNSSLALDYTSYINILPPDSNVELPCYPRIKKMPDGSYMMIYQQNDQAFNVYYATSRNLIDWEDRGTLFGQKNESGAYKRYDYIDGSGTFIPRFTTGEAVVLNNGTVLAIATLRVKPSTGEDETTERNMKNSGLVLRESTDNGKTWSAERIIFRVKNWEPYALQLASGEIQIYFTKSNPIKGDSGTAMISSTDNGKTWVDRGFVARQKSNEAAVDGSGDAVYTDQMPVARELNGGKGIALALESRIGSGDNKVYHISMAYSHDNWATPICVNYNVTNAVHQSNFIQKSGSPYLVQFPSGETALSYNTGGVFQIRVGGTEADFRNLESLKPFPKKASWGSMEIIDSHVMVATFPGGATADMGRSIQVGKFILNHRVDAPQLTPTIDGANSDWDEVDDALFLGSATPAQAAIRFCSDADNIYCLVERIDDNVTATDTFDIMLQGGGTATPIKFTLTPAEDLKGMRCSDTRARCAANFKTDADEIRKGYVVELAIPRSILSITGDKLFFNAVLHEGSNTDTFFNLTDSNCQKWMIIGL